MKSKLLRAAALIVSLAASSLVSAGQASANPYGTIPPAPVPIDSCGGTADDQFRIPRVTGWRYDFNGTRVYAGSAQANSTNGASTVTLDVYDETILPAQYVTSYTMSFPNNTPCVVGADVIRLEVGPCQPQPNLPPIGGNPVTAWFTNNSGQIRSRLLVSIKPVVPTGHYAGRTVENIPPGAPYPITFEDGDNQPGIPQAGTYDAEFRDVDGTTVIKTIRFSIPFTPPCNQGPPFGDPLYPQDVEPAAGLVKRGDQVQLTASNVGVTKKTQFRFIVKVGKKQQTTQFAVKANKRVVKRVPAIKGATYLVEAKFAKAGKKAVKWQRIRRLIL